MLKIANNKRRLLIIVTATTIGIGSILFDNYFINKTCKIKPISLFFNFQPTPPPTTSLNNVDNIYNNNTDNKKENKKEIITLLDNKELIIYKDHFVTEININNNEITIEDFAKAFFTSPIFTPELKLLSTTTKEEINNKIKFNIGDSVFPFKVINKIENKELLFYVNEGFDSLTWLKIVNKTNFTTSESTTVKNSEEKQINNNCCFELHYGSALLDRSLGRKVVLFSLLPFHYIYSRYLLAGAKRKLEEKFK
ncbi:hypothetical protein ABK040_004600 [Willaertia magna]